MCFVALGPLFYESAIISFVLGGLFITAYSIYRPFQWVEPFYIQGQRRTEHVKNLLSLSELLPAVALLITLNLIVYFAITVVAGQVFASGYNEYAEVFTNNFLNNIKDGCDVDKLDDKRIVNWYLPMYASLAMIGVLPIVSELKIKNFDLSKVKSDQICQSLIGVREKLPRILNIVSNANLKKDTIPRNRTNDEEYKRITFCKNLLRISTDRYDLLQSKDKSYINILNRSYLTLDLIESIRNSTAGSSIDNSDILELLEKDALRVSSVSLCKSTSLKNVETVLNQYDIEVSDEFDTGEWKSIDHFVMIFVISSLFISFVTLMPPLILGFLPKNYTLPWDVSYYFPTSFDIGISVLLTWAITYLFGFGIAWWLRGAMGVKSWFDRKQVDGIQKYVKPSPLTSAVALVCIYFACTISMFAMSLLLQWSVVDEAFVIATLKQTVIFSLPASAVIFLALSFADTAILKPSTSTGRKIIDVIFSVIVVIFFTLIPNAIVLNLLQEKNLPEFSDFLIYVTFVNVCLLILFYIYLRKAFKAVYLK